MAPGANMMGTMSQRLPANQTHFSQSMTGAFSMSPFTMNANIPGVTMPNLAGGSTMRNTPGGYGNAMGGYGASSMMYAGGNSMPAYSGGYGNASQSYSGSAAAGAGQASMTATSLGASNVLDAMGVANQGGQISWPCELRVMGPSEVTDLRKQVEGLMKMASMQATQGQVNPRIVEAARKAVDRLDVLLLRDRERGGLGMTSYKDSKRFLDQLKEGLKLFQ
jgi:hypothetical protein